MYLVALLLHLFERAEIAFALTREAALLNAEIAELALIGDVDLRVDERLAQELVLIREFLGKLDVADCEDAHLKTGYA